MFPIQDRDYLDDADLLVMMEQMRIRLSFNYWERGLSSFKV
jgi:hypothetical protein